MSCVTDERALKQKNKICIMDRICQTLTTIAATADHKCFPLRCASFILVLLSSLCLIIRNICWKVETQFL